MIDIDKLTLESQLKGSLLGFTQFFYKHITSRDFIMSWPQGRESHQITVCRALTQAARLELPTQGLTINIPPGNFKSTFVCMFVAWTLAHYPDSQYLYISYSHDLAAKHTAFIKSIVSSRMYNYLFGISLNQESRAKDFFKTTAGGSVRAFGSSGAVTGQDAGVPIKDEPRFTGACIIDDAIKPDDAHSDTIRASIQRNYEETIRQRLRSPFVPIINIGQRLHEDDLGAFMLSGKDVYQWTDVVLPALDDAGNALCPFVHPKELLLKIQDKSPYVFASQFQQNPIPAGGALFKPDWFVQLDEEPKMRVTFITADTAETTKKWNDATVFSFWGVYEIEVFGRKTGDLGLHWIDCVELRIEPKDLKETFMDFWGECMRYKTPPRFAAIEKKSTGVTLISVLEEIRGMQIRNIERSAASGSKSDRFVNMQHFIKSRFVSIPTFGKHKDMCLEHMKKITANDSHRWDDIADTLCDAIKIALIDKSINYRDNTQSDKIASDVMQQNDILKRYGDY